MISPPFSYFTLPKNSNNLALPWGVMRLGVLTSMVLRIWSKISSWVAQGLKRYWLNGVLFRILGKRQYLLKGEGRVGALR